MSTLQSVINEVIAERVKQDDKWGEQNHLPIVWNAILVEEVGEVSKALIEAAMHEKKQGYIKHEQHVETRLELIQVAAVAVAMVQSIDRNQLHNYVPPSNN
jgi:hypothetical protein